MLLMTVAIFLVAIIDTASAAQDSAVSWEAVSAISAAVAALAAAAATFLALWSQVESNRGRQRTRRGEHYRLLVFDPAHQVLRDFHESFMTLLDEATHDLDSLVQNDSAHSLLQKRVGSLIDAFNDGWFKLKASVIIGAEAWGDQILRDQLRRSLEALQDDGTKNLARLSMPNERRAIVDAMNIRTALIMKVLAEGDPAVQTSTARRWRT